MIYKTRHFNRWAGKTLLSDELLRRAVEEMTLMPILAAAFSKSGRLAGEREERQCQDSSGNQPR